MGRRETGRKGEKEQKERRKEMTKVRERRRKYSKVGKRLDGEQGLAVKILEIFSLIKLH